MYYYFSHILFIYYSTQICCWSTNSHYNFRHFHSQNILLLQTTFSIFISIDSFILAFLIFSYLSYSLLKCLKYNKVTTLFLQHLIYSFNKTRNILWSILCTMVYTVNIFIFLLYIILKGTFFYFISSFPCS